jgi:hypothetical protein
VVPRVGSVSIDNVPFTGHEDFCKEFGEQQRVEIDFQTHDLSSLVPPDISLCLFRVLQEALHNSAKHSGVRHFEVRLWETSDGIHLTVRDSGSGFDREAAKAARGVGLISMEERLKTAVRRHSPYPQRSTKREAFLNSPKAVVISPCRAITLLLFAADSHIYSQTLRSWLLLLRKRETSLIW